jgi:hypothetical protein
MDLLTSERVDLMIDLWNDPDFKGSMSTERCMQYWESKGWDTSRYTPEEFNRIWDLAQDEWDNRSGYIEDEEFEDGGRFQVEGYYDSRYVGLAESMTTNDFSEATDSAHAYLSNGDYTLIFDTKTGKEIRFDPDTYFEDFEGEFPASITDFDPDYFD